MALPQFPLQPTTQVHETLRQDVRAFLAGALTDLPASERARSWTGFDARFSAELDKRGWLGMTLPGITISPVLDIAGEHHFNEVSFKDVVLAPDALLGKEGDGWAQVMSELAFERSGPDRFLSSFVLVDELLRCLKRSPGIAPYDDIGRMVARLIILRQMSLSVAGRLANGEQPTLAASIVKDLGALFEQDVPEIARRVQSAVTRRRRPRICAGLSPHPSCCTKLFTARWHPRNIAWNHCTGSWITMIEKISHLWVCLLRTRPEYNGLRPCSLPAQNAHV